MMQALITELPQPYNQLIFNIWTELEQEFSISKARGMTPIPHFTWHVAESYSPEVIQTVQQFLKQHPMPEVQTTGLAIFHGEAPVVYIGIKATIPLVSYHNKFMENIIRVAQGSSEFYGPNLWTPHITLALDDTNPKIVGGIFMKYSNQNFKWNFVPDNVLLVSETEQGNFDISEIIKAI